MGKCFMLVHCAPFSAQRTLAHSGRKWLRANGRRMVPYPKPGCLFHNDVWVFPAKSDEIRFSLFCHRLLKAFCILEITLFAYFQNLDRFETDPSSVCICHHSTNHTTRLFPVWFKVLNFPVWFKVLNLYILIQP